MSVFLQRTRHTVLDMLVTIIAFIFFLLSAFSVTIAPALTSASDHMQESTVCFFESRFSETICSWLSSEDLNTALP